MCSPGAPKDRKEDGRGSVLLAVQRANQLLTLQTLRGQQTGSYFGNAVAAVDLDNDGSVTGHMTSKVT